MAVLLSMYYVSVMSLLPLQEAPKAARPEPKVLFDGKSLDGWKVADFIEKGKVSVKDGAVVLGEGNPMTGIAYIGKDFPRVDYEVTLEGKKISGEDFFCTTTFPVGEAYCSLVVGGWGGMVVGLSSLNGADASENETTGSKEFKKDQWYKVRIRVTKNRIQAWIDKERVVNVDTQDKKVSIRLECRPCLPFGVATYRTTGAIRALSVRALTEAEKKEAAQQGEDR